MAHGPRPCPRRLSFHLAYGTWCALILLGLGIGLAAAPAARVAPPIASPDTKGLDGVRLTDPLGVKRSLAEFKEAEVLVLVFVGTACPVSNRSVAPLSRLQARYRSRGVQIVGINANLDDPLAAVARHAKEFRITFPVFKDPHQELANQLQARITPEVFLLDRQRAIRYRGRIDVAAGEDPGGPGTRTGNLKTALDELLAGKKVTTPVTRAHGCPIGRPAKKAPAIASVTFHRDVRPILEQRCQSCHRPGQVGPFSLTTYAGAQLRAAQIRELVASREMPPWLAEPGYGDFEHPRRLTTREISTLSAWADAGAPEGMAAGTPAPRKWPTGWELGKPDLVLTVSRPYRVAAEGEDEFRVFVLPTDLMRDEQVIGMEFHPGNGRAVHHMLALFDGRGRGRELDTEDPEPGYRSAPGSVRIPTATLQGVWTPGNSPRLLPSGVGRLLPAETDLLLQVHYHKTGRVETDQSSIGLYFAKEPTPNSARTVVVGGYHPPIPAGEANYRVHSSETMPVDVRLLTITPHMHLLGKEMKVSATLPDGSKKDLVWIRNWDYRWQEAYRYKVPLLLPRGTRVEIATTFDNSTKNPRNPSRPPREVLFGEETTDEMASVILEGVVQGN